MARTSTAMDVPFHSDIGFLAQRGRRLLRDPYKAATKARRLSIYRRPASRDQPLPRRAQSEIAALHLDRRSRRNHRRRQARAPSVRFDPLGRRSTSPRRRRNASSISATPALLNIFVPARSLPKRSGGVGVWMLRGATKGRTRTI